MKVLFKNPIPPTTWRGLIVGDAFIFEADYSDPQYVAIVVGPELALLFYSEGNVEELRLLENMPTIIQVDIDILVSKL